MRNRSKRAREQAGLSLAQAAKYLGMSQDAVAHIEDSDEAYDAADKIKLADAYGVGIEWMDGSRAERDYASIDSMRGADSLSFHDRDVLAEFAASLPRRPR
jgi:transcriptional regulator with XRE-family HTH domain